MYKTRCDLRVKCLYGDNILKYRQRKIKQPPLNTENIQKSNIGRELDDASKKKESINEVQDCSDDNIIET